MEVYGKNSYLQALDSEHDQMAPRILEIEHKKRLVDHFDKKLKDRTFIPDLIEELSRLTPQEISFSAMSLDARSSVTIQGFARDHAAISEFQKRLIRSDYFAQVDLQFATKRVIANRPVMDFKIALRLKQDNVSSSMQISNNKFQIPNNIQSRNSNDQ